jgi:hypothetical protein
MRMILKRKKKKLNGILFSLYEQYIKFAKFSSIVGCLKINAIKSMAKVAMTMLLLMRA